MVSLQDWSSQPYQVGEGDLSVLVDFTDRVVSDCLNNKVNDSNQGGGDEDNQQVLFNDLSWMTDLMSGPHQEDNESSTAAKKKPWGINMEDEDPHAEFSNAGLGGIDHAPGSVQTSFSPLTVDSMTHS